MTGMVYLIGAGPGDVKLITVKGRECIEKADVIVLGCTHYHWIEQEIREIAAGKALVLQPETPVLTELKRVLAQLA